MFGSNLECAPLVMYESFASKTAFVTTNAGNVRDHEGYLKIVDTPTIMAKETNYLLDNDKEREALVNKAYGLWENNHTTEKIIDKYEEHFKELIGQSKY